LIFTLFSKSVTSVWDDMPLLVSK